MKHSQNSHKKHLLLMMLGCLVPIILIVIIRLFGIGNKTFLRVFSSYGFLICPLLHIFMMKGILGRKKAVIK